VLQRWSDREKDRVCNVERKKCLARKRKEAHPAKNDARKNS
jgi:hypothetical protein